MVRDFFRIKGRRDHLSAILATTGRPDGRTRLTRKKEPGFLSPSPIWYETSPVWSHLLGRHMLSHHKVHPKRLTHDICSTCCPTFVETPPISKSAYSCPKTQRNIVYVPRKTNHCSPTSWSNYFTPGFIFRVQVNV